MPADNPDPAGISDHDVVRLTGIIAWQRIAMGAILALMLMVLVAFATRGLWQRGPTTTVDGIYTQVPEGLDAGVSGGVAEVGVQATTVAAVGGLEASDKVKWVVHTTSKYLRAPVPGPDGMVYVYTRPSTVYAIANDGSVEWRHSIDEFNVGQILPAGEHVLVQTEKSVEAVDEQGNVAWTYEPGTEIESLAVGPSAEIYACVASERIVKTAEGKDWAVDCCYVVHLDGQGHERWSFDAESSVAWPILCDYRGAVFLACDRGMYTEEAMLHCISADGKLLWRVTDRHKFGEPVETQGAICTHVPGASNMAEVRSYSEKGDIEWSTELPLTMDGRKWSLSYDTILVEADSPRGGVNKELVMLGASRGEVRWRVEIPEPLLGQPGYDNLDLMVAVGKRDLLWIDREGIVKTQVEAEEEEWVGVCQLNGPYNLDVWPRAFAFSSSGISWFDEAGELQGKISLANPPLTFSNRDELLFVTTVSGEIAALDPFGPFHDLR